MKSKTKNQKHDKNRGVKSPPPPSRQPAVSTRRWLVLGLVALVTAVGTWALLEYVVWAKLPPELVGKWVVVGGPQDGATFDFFRHGSLVAVVNIRGSEAVVNARIEVEGKKIFSTTQNPNTGREETRVQMIRTLTETELVVEDQDGVVLKMERAR